MKLPGWGPGRVVCQGRPPDWRVRVAGDADLLAIAASVGDLLSELGARPPREEAMRDAAAAILAAPERGVLLLADAHGETIGYLGASWQSAVRVPGRYGLIQELWVRRRWRKQRVGEGLLRALFALAPAHGVTRLEVGLPGTGFSELEGTEAFYRQNGFEQTGSRMRRMLP